MQPGSGKSTLLAVVLGDHPQSYANAVTLFAKPRDSIATATLQSHIGYCSPEVFNAFPRKYSPGSLTALDAIGTGFESIYSYRKMSPEQLGAIYSLADKFGLDRAFLRKLFAELKGGEQSLVLFLRALIKRPKLLILDEPFAFMSEEMVQRCRQYIDQELDPRQAVVMVRL